MYEKKVFLGFIRVHILHHAAEEGIYGVWMMDELRRHGYSISPGTLYPILHEMEHDGVIRSRSANVGGKVRRIYTATHKGRKVLVELSEFVSELFHEVVQ